MRAEIVISFEHATALWGHTGIELLWVDGYGVSSVVEEIGDPLDPTRIYAIDGQVVGRPYTEAAASAQEHEHLLESSDDSGSYGCVDCSYQTVIKDRQA